MPVTQILSATPMGNPTDRPALVLVGPTAVGKTELSLVLAERFSGEIISVDSMQVYRYMEIGTAKATPAERARVAHHLLDLVDPDEEYHAGRFVEDATTAWRRIHRRGHLPLLVGGTGLYFRALLQGLFASPDIPLPVREHLRQRLRTEGQETLYEELRRCDPVSAARIHVRDTQRLLRGLEIFQATGVPWSTHLERQKSRPVAQKILKVGLTWDREELYRRIDLRVELMIEQGFLEEVRGLLARGYGGHLKSMQSLGYRHLVQYLAGDRDWQDTLELLARDTRRYAKRQYTWFRRDAAIHWFRPDQTGEILALVEAFLRRHEEPGTKAII